MENVLSQQFVYCLIFIYEGFSSHRNFHFYRNLLCNVLFVNDTIWLLRLNTYSLSFLVIRTCVGVVQGTFHSQVTFRQLFLFQLFPALQQSHCWQSTSQQYHWKWESKRWLISVVPNSVVHLQIIVLFYLSCVLFSNQEGKQINGAQHAWKSVICSQQS